jgi:hypothetical protein
MLLKKPYLNVGAFLLIQHDILYFLINNSIFKNIMQDD